MLCALTLIRVVIFMKKIFYLFLTFSFLFFSFNIVLADNFYNYGLDNLNLKATELFGNADIPTVVANVIKVLMGLSATVMLVVILYAGFVYLTSAGDSKKTQKAFDLIKSSAIGIIIIVTAYSLSQFIINNIKFIAS